MKVRFISPKIHGIIDYLAAVLLIVSPFAWGLGSSSPLAIWLSVAGGIAVIVYSLITDYHFGIAKVIPFGGHLAIDLLAGVAFTLSPFLFRFQGMDAAYYFLNAAVIYLVVALTAEE